MAKAKSGLGKGIDLLIPQGSETENETPVTLKTSQIEPNRNQPRKQFDEEALAELADSVKQYGIIQPIIVTKKDDYYEIIAGERRWRAAKKAGLKEVPVVIRDYTEREIAEISLIENIQREDLNPIEEALGYRQLIEEYNLTQEELAERISKSRTAITNTMRLLKLDEKVQQHLIEGALSAGHARALLSIESPEGQAEIAEKIIKDSLSVRQTEDLVKDFGKQKKKPTKTVKKSVFVKDLEKQMTNALGTQVRIQNKDDGKGKIEISFYSDEDLDRLFRVINKGAQ
ncbi:MAG: ParB/RepB/Spo0J family partition protein [Parasporobacterium sp.]|nr:ParB/RepB/Spo0J family partition protein [Parasporobacterium sp.]